LSAYERGIELFAFPHAGAKLLWKAYINTFLKRYKGTKVERARNIFQRCLENCPAEECAEFYMLNGEFEEEYGLTKRSLSVYKDMCDNVPSADKYIAYQLFITKTIKYLGVPATRDIYQDAIEKLAKVNVSLVVKMCIDFAKMEVGLNQIARARAIFVYGAQSADPRRLPEYWKAWNDFEIAHGNEDTFREMLRVKRSVEAAFSTINYNAAGMTETVSNFTNEEAMRMIAAGEGMEFDDTKDVSTSVVSGFVPSSSNKRTMVIDTLRDVEERVAKLRKITGAVAMDPAIPANEESSDYIDDDEINLEDIDAEIAEAANEGVTLSSTTVPHLVHDIVPIMAIPDAVFGSLAAIQTRGSNVDNK
jgi:pre-mRNA-splicing factor SYF1